MPDADDAASQQSSNQSDQQGSEGPDFSDFFTVLKKSQGEGTHQGIVKPEITRNEDQGSDQ